MSKQRKYAASGGLAFTEQKDMDKLSRLAAKGWFLESFALLGYRLRKGQPQQLIYCVDYNLVDERGMADYTGLFEAGGWQRVCSKERIHIFSAPKGTRPIYSDQDTEYEKYHSSVKMMKPFLAAPLLTIILVALLLFVPSMEASAPVLKNIFLVLTAIGVILSVPVLMTYISLFIRLRSTRRTY